MLRKSFSKSVNTVILKWSTPENHTLSTYVSNQLGKSLDTDINPPSSEYSARNLISIPLLSKKYAREQYGKALLIFSRHRFARDSTFSTGTLCPPFITRFAILAMLIAVSLFATKYRYVLNPDSFACLKAVIFDGWENTVSCEKLLPVAMCSCWRKLVRSATVYVLTDSFLEFTHFLRREVDFAPCFLRWSGFRKVYFAYRKAKLLPVIYLEQFGEAR